MNHTNHSSDNVPELRFPEFVNDGEWEEKKLGEVAEIITGNTPSTNDSNNYDGSNLFVSPADINKSRYVYQTKTTLSDIGFSKTRQINANSVLFVCIGSTIGKVAQTKSDCATNQQINSLVANKGFSNDFLYSLLDYNSQNIASIAGNHAVPIINKTTFSAVELMFPPSLKEQQKIASCLSSLDEAIAAHSQKLEALKDHKKGLMQTLFPQEGKTVPQYRFPEFVDDGEWVEKKLGELGNFMGGGTPNKSNPEYWIGDIPWISSSDIRDNDIHNISITRFINDDAIKQSATKIIPIGSILFVSRVGVGKLAINNQVLCTSQDFTSFVPNSIHNYFIGYYFSANKHLLQSLNQGTSIKVFSKSDLENFLLMYPKNQIEQQKIADCLSSLDASITAQADKIEALKLHKKGLMQGLFPRV